MIDFQRYLSLRTREIRWALRCKVRVRPHPGTTTCVLTAVPGVLSEERVAEEEEEATAMVMATGDAHARKEQAEEQQMEERQADRVHLKLCRCASTICVACEDYVHCGRISCFIWQADTFAIEHKTSLYPRTPNFIGHRLMIFLILTAIGPSVKSCPEFLAVIEIQTMCCILGIYGCHDIFRGRFECEL